MHDWGPLGEVLHRDRSANAEQNRANVRTLVGQACQLLSLIPETFPTYTMHNEQHALNIIDKMGKLAAPRIDEMTGLEAALLILAAYFHDAGMAYTEDELAAIVDEEEFEQFLEDNDEAYLATQRNGGVPPRGVKEHYCRFRHADRARVQLDRCDQKALTWDGISIVDELEMICRSHNEPTAALHEPRFDTDHLFQADLRFCAVLLRLGDILDLDDTRAPTLIYDHLGLGDRASAEAAVSDQHWRMHLAARGFQFPLKPPRRGYRLQFVARPEEPGVEHDLRRFLAVIQDELLQSRGVVDNCGDRWRGIPLPTEIDTSKVVGQGYKYGEFRFELDRTAVLELFTGERLYDDPCAFLRELLQNALDAIRAREHLFGHESAGVHVSCWEDGEGYVWVRVDDDGIGMDEDAIRRYFLRIGQSLYRSAEFEAEATRGGMADKPFGVIGRFGVGVLSCFMVGDRVELSSRRARDGRGGKAVRLSINRRDDYFVLQEAGRPGQRDRKMVGHPDEAFPQRAGTRIAVRINPDRAGVDVDTILAKVESYVFAPPVPVLVNGRPVATETNRMISEPILPKPEIVEFGPADFRGWKSMMPLPYTAGVRIAAIPLDLGRAGCPDVCGQLLAYFALPPSDPAAGRDLLAGWAERDEEVGAVLASAVASLSFSLTGDMGVERYCRPGVAFVVHRWIRDECLQNALKILSDRGQTAVPYVRYTDTTAGQEASHLHEHPDALQHALNVTRGEWSPNNIGRVGLPRERLPATQQWNRFVARQTWWAHNGVALPTSGNDLTRSAVPRSSPAFLIGAVSLSGELRPDLTVARSKVVTVPFSVHSALQMAIRRAARAAVADDPGLSDAIPAISDMDLLVIPPAEPCALTTPWADRLVRGGVWNSEPVIPTPSGTTSIDDLKSAVRAGNSPIVRPSWFAVWPSDDELLPSLFTFYNFLACSLLQLFLEVEWTPAEPDRDGVLRVVSDHPHDLTDEAFLFPPLFAVPFRADPPPARARGRLNARHPLAQWLITNATTLAADFPAPFQRVFRQATHIRELDVLNAALDRVARARPDIAPPPEAYVRKDEHGWWWSRD